MWLILIALLSGAPVAEAAGTPVSPHRNAIIEQRNFMDFIDGMYMCSPQWWHPVHSYSVSPGPHMLAVVLFRGYAAVVAAAEPVVDCVCAFVRDFEISVGVDFASFVFIVCVSIVFVCAAVVLFVRMWKAAVELAEAERLVGEATPLKESVIDKYEIVYVDNAAFIRVLVGDAVFLVPCTPEIKAEIAFASQTPKVVKGGPEMAIGGHPRVELRPPNYLVQLVAGDRVRGLGFRAGDTLVTAKHVLRKLAEFDRAYMVNPLTQKQVELLREWSSPIRAIGCDVGTVSVPPAIWAVMGVSKGKLCRARDGEAVTVYGRDPLGKMVASKGVVKPLSLFVLSHNCSSEKGDSGGPLVSRRGIVGVHWGGRAERGLNAAVAVDFLCDILESDNFSSDPSEASEVYHERHEPRDKQREESDFLATLNEAKSGIGGRLVILRSATQTVEAYRSDGTAYTRVVTTASLDQFRGPSWADLEDEEGVEGEEADGECEPFNPSSAAVGPLSRPDFRASQEQVLAQVPQPCETLPVMSGLASVSSLKEASDLTKSEEGQPPSQPTDHPRRRRRGKGKPSSSSPGSRATPGHLAARGPKSEVSDSKPPAMTWASIHQARKLRESSQTSSTSTPKPTSPTISQVTPTSTASAKAT
jgi:hypothetical protein